MRYKIFSIRDRAADVFSQPWFFPSKGVAIRSFGDEINKKDSGSNLSAHPEDFDLYFLGEFDDESGTFDTSNRPEQIAVGKDLVR